MNKVIRSGIEQWTACQIHNRCVLSVLDSGTFLDFKLILKEELSKSDQAFEELNTGLR